jgi:hypothetical protein
MFQTAIFQKYLVFTQYPIERVQSVLPPGVKSSERETLHWHLFVADVRNTLSYTDPNIRLMIKFKTLHYLAEASLPLLNLARLNSNDVGPTVWREVMTLGFASP